MTPEDFAAEARRIASEYRGHAAHRAFDAMCNNLLSTLGYFEGVEVFQKAVHDWHEEAAPYPRPPIFNWRCLFGRHEWINTTPDHFRGWGGTASCNRCGKKYSSGNPCP